jgi:hypothetical protein
VPAAGQEGIALLTEMLRLNPAHRISAKAALNHEFFASMPADWKVVCYSVVRVLLHAGRLEGSRDAPT